MAKNTSKNKSKAPPKTAKSKKGLPNNACPPNVRRSVIELDVSGHHSGEGAAWAWYDNLSRSYQYGFDADASTPRAELIGALKAVESAFRPVELHTPSDYLVRGYNEWMPRWQSLGWKKPKSSSGGSRRLQNRDLWALLFLASLDKSFTIVRAPRARVSPEFLDPAWAAPGLPRTLKGSAVVSEVFQHNSSTAAFFSDGSFANGKGAWAWCSTNGAHLAGRAAKTHSSLTAELWGVLEALLTAYKAGLRRAVIYCDCLPAVDLIRSEEKTLQKNHEVNALLGRIRNGMSMFDEASVLWVRGHRGVRENVIVDLHARKVWAAEFR